MSTASSATAAPAATEPAASAGAELRQLLRLAAPIALVQIGQNAMGFVDVAVLGHYRSDALAAMSLGNVLSWGVAVFCMGVLTALDPLLSQAIGARDPQAVTRHLLRGAWLAVWLALPAMAVMLPAETWLLLLGQSAELAPDAGSYARVVAWSFLPLLWFHLLRTLLAAQARVWVQVAVIGGANVANAVLDWALVFGRLGLPELGVAGAAWTTVVCRWLMVAALAALGWRQLAPHLAAARDRALRAQVVAVRPLLRLLRLGTPIGVQFSLEMGVFALTALLIGWFGEHPLGGHQVALQFASMSFMVPLGLSMATAVRVGWAVGRGDMAAARRTARVALLAGAAVMAAFMVVFLAAPGVLAGWITDVPEVAAQAALLLPIAGVFQVGDGLQVVAIGCLRGLGIVRAPMVANVAGFWLIGLPVGCGLGFAAGLGPAGLWWGLCVGLFAVAVALLWLMRGAFAGPRARLALD